MERCLIVFAKEPQKGRVKTRLRSILSDAVCLRLYKAFLQDTVELVQRVKCEERVIAYDSAKGLPQYLKTIAPGFNFYRQEGRDLGQKMHNAFRYAQKMKAERTVIIGSDSPDLPADYITEAFRKMDEGDVVLGPCRDGGYYLIGLKYPCETLFRGIKWSSGDVSRATLKKARDVKKKVVFLKKWYDIDTPESLACLVSHLKNRSAAPYTRRVLKCMNLKAIIP